MTDPRKLWQGQSDIAGTMTPAEIPRAASRLARRIKWREWRVYLAAMIWMPFAAFQGYTATPVIFWGEALLILGGLYAMWRQRRQTREINALTTKDFLETYRLQLMKERDLLWAARRNRLLPFFPGIIVIMVGIALLDRPLTPVVLITNGCIVAGLYAVLGWRHKRLAHRLQKELDALGAEQIG